MSAWAAPPRESACFRVFLHQRVGALALATATPILSPSSHLRSACCRRRLSAQVQEAKVRTVASDSRVSAVSHRALTVALSGPRSDVTTKSSSIRIDFLQQLGSVFLSNRITISVALDLGWNWRIVAEEEMEFARLLGVAMSLVNADIDPNLCVKKLERKLNLIPASSIPLK